MLRLVRKVIGMAVLLALASCAKAGPDPIAAFFKGRPAAFVFLAPDCPLSQNYVPTLNELKAHFQTNHVELYAVFPGDVRPDEFVSNYQLKLPVIRDADFRLTEFFHATTTPQAFVVDSDGRTMYDGAIDNRAPELGQQRRVITEHYLLDALTAAVRHTDVAIKHTQPVGCFIEIPH
jgi:hypothetical protein